MEVMSETITLPVTQLVIPRFQALVQKYRKEHGAYESLLDARNGHNMVTYEKAAVKSYSLLSGRIGPGPSVGLF
jgi:hypothetical protein